MGKRTIKTATTEVINPTKDMTISFKNAAAANGSKLIFDGNSTPISAANGKDLCIVTLFGDLKGGDANCVVTTIKNYFKYVFTNINLVSVGTSENAEENMEGDEVYEICSIGKGMGYVLGKKKISGSLATSLGGRNATTYNISSLIVDGFLVELGGNDKYTYSRKYENGDDKLRITDISGKDKYNLINESYTTIFDQKGNDKYTINNAKTVINEYQGKDKYTVKNCKTEDINDFVINDKAGNDKYTITSSENMLLNDSLGSDKYTISNTTKLKLEDFEGNDKYSFSKVSNDGLDADEYYVKDYKGNDKYSISAESASIYFQDVYGNDKYTLSNSSNISISDNSGNDTYTFKKDLTNASIVDASGDDTYTFDGKKKAVISNSGANAVTIQDCGATVDKYTFKYVKGEYSNAMDIAVVDDGAGDDKYSFSNSTYQYVNDKSGNDTYTIDSKSNGIIVQDDDGAGDTLTITGAKAKNVIFMADVYTGALFAYNNKTNTYLRIENFFELNDGWDVDNANTQRFTGYDVGRIETIKIKDKKAIVATIPDANSYTHSVMQNVAAFLDDKGKGFSDILNSGNKTDINTLIGIYNGNSYTMQNV